MLALALTHHVTREKKEEGCSRPGFKPVATVVKDSGFRLKAGQPLTPPSLLGEGDKRAVARMSSFRKKPLETQRFWPAKLTLTGPRRRHSRTLKSVRLLWMLYGNPRWDLSIPGARFRLPEDAGVLFHTSCRRCTRTRQFRHTVDIVPPFRVRRTCM
jgi:hypothetical protein